jgi:coenzyme Q-binding protein COQ10
MASAHISEVYNCTAEEFFKVVADYEKYPEFLTGVSSVKITKNDGTTKEMEYAVSIVKSFKYKLKVTEISPTSVVFTFLSGEMFKTMKGSWTIKPEGEKCKVDYSVDATFGMLVPSFMADQVVKINLPIMVQNFKTRIKKIYGK